jgi:hypothetical protein
MSVRGRSILWIAASLSVLSASPSISQPPDLTYHTVTPCVLVDTRTTGGTFTAGETRTYNVAGSCDVPAWSNNIAQAQAVALTITAITPTGSGHIKAFAADQAGTTSVLNFTTSVNIANTTPVALAQTPGVGDIKINVSNWTTHVLLTVVGYYSRDIQTVHVHPVPGDGPASGTRLINALAGITDASATKRYVVKVEPGIYDVGATMLVMKPYVDIEGSGQEATVIQGVGTTDTTATIAVVKGASSSELRDLQVRSTGSASEPYSIGIVVIDAVDASIRDVTVYTSGGSGNWGIRNSGSPSHIAGVTVNAQAGSAFGYGIGNKFPLATPIIERTVINVTGGSTGFLYGISGVYCAPKEIRDVKVNVTGGLVANGFYVDNSTATVTGTRRITNSTITATDASGESHGVFVQYGSIELDIEQSQIRAIGSSSTGIMADGSQVRVKSSEVAGATTTVEAWTAEVGASLLDGGELIGISSGTCAGVYDEAFTFYASTCP